MNVLKLKIIFQIRQDYLDFQFSFKEHILKFLDCNC